MFSWEMVFYQIQSVPGKLLNGCNKEGGMNTSVAIHYVAWESEPHKKQIPKRQDAFVFSQKRLGEWNNVDRMKWIVHLSGK